MKNKIIEIPLPDGRKVVIINGVNQNTLKIRSTRLTDIPPYEMFKAGSDANNLFNPPKIR